MSDEPEQDDDNADENFQAGYDVAMADIDAELSRARAVTTLASAHRLLARSLELDDTRPTLAEIESAICRLVRKVAPDAE